MFEPTTINDVVKAINALKKIERPDGDNEGDPINASSVYDLLPEEQQDIVDEKVEIINRYIRDSGDEPNKRAINTMIRRGYETYLHPDQHDPDRLVGSVIVGELEIDVSDPSTENEDD